MASRAQSLCVHRPGLPRHVRYLRRTDHRSRFGPNLHRGRHDVDGPEQRLDNLPYDDHANEEGLNSRAAILQNLFLKATPIIDLF